MTPEHLHLALNHIVFIGSGLALIPLLVGFFTKSRPTLLSGFLIAALCGWTTPFIMDTGEKAYERYKAGEVTPYLDAEAYDYLEEHEHFAHDWSKVMYVSAGLASLGIVLLYWRPAIARPFSLLVMLLCLTSLILGILIAETGGEIRRVDFREAPAS